MTGADVSILAVQFLLGLPDCLEEGGSLYGIRPEEQETAELAAFIRAATRELERRQGRCSVTPLLEPVRITPGLRIFIGPRELKIRPMAKAVLLLFLAHPEGIPLKCLPDHRAELTGYYRRLCRFGAPSAVEAVVARVLDIFSNEASVNISRVNAAVSALVRDPVPYRIEGASGAAKTIRLDRSMVLWEGESAKT